VQRPDPKSESRVWNPLIGAVGVLAVFTAFVLGCGGGGGGSSSSSSGSGSDSGDTDSDTPTDPASTFPASLSDGDTFTTTIAELASIVVVDATTVEITNNSGVGLAAISSYTGSGATASLSITVLPGFESTLDLLSADLSFTASTGSIAVDATGTLFDASALGPVSGTATFTNN